jgi:hypothetical protein
VSCSKTATNIHEETQLWREVKGTERSEALSLKGEKVEGRGVIDCVAFSLEYRLVANEPELSRDHMTLPLETHNFTCFYISYSQNNLLFTFNDIISCLPIKIVWFLPQITLYLSRFNHEPTRVQTGSSKLVVLLVLHLLHGTSSMAGDKVRQDILSQFPAH